MSPAAASGGWLSIEGWLQEPQAYQAMSQAGDLSHPKSPAPRERPARAR